MRTINITQVEDAIERGDCDLLAGILPILRVMAKGQPVRTEQGREDRYITEAKMGKPQKVELAQKLLRRIKAICPDLL